MRIFRVVIMAVLGVVTPLLPAASETTLVVPHHYIIQRRASNVAALSAEQITYTTVKPHEFFDVVVPVRYGRSASIASSSKKEPHDPVKVSADCADILKDPTVVSCEPDVWRWIRALPSDTHFGLQWHLNDLTHNGDVEMPAAWERGTGSKDTLVGVIDTGINASHPDLAANLWINPSDPVDGLDNDSNGYVDDVYGVNTALHTSDPEDLEGHGTHVSGIIGARGNNGTGVTGMMWEASLIVVSAAADGSGGFSLSAILGGYNYFHGLKVRGHNIRVINASFGSTQYSAAEYSAIARLHSVDILLVAAAGNENINNDNVPSYPCDYELPNIISVGATGPTLQSAGYSNYGASVDIAAPGGDSSVGPTWRIYSTLSPTISGGSSYGYLQGTSMASPVVAGAIGLLASQRPYLSGGQLKSLTLSSADQLSALAPYVASGRFLNVGSMANASEPSDECPSDLNKIAAGICGCGVADSYVDSDSDEILDCIDGCPVDSGKASAGICGCGASDVDQNGNGTADCSDPAIAALTPKVPTLKTSKGKITITMKGLAGVRYFLKVVVQAPRGKAKTTYYSSTTTVVVISKLKSKSNVSISYAYFLPGTSVVASKYSAAKKIKVK